MKKKTKIVLGSALAVLALGGLAVGGYFTYKHFNPAEQQKPVDPGVTPPDDGGEQPLTQTITFEIEGQEPIVQSVATGGLITPPTDPTKEGYIFQGWALEGTSDIVDFSTLTVTQNMTFVAIWEEEPTSASKFTFDGTRLTGYIGEETDIVIPASYSLGEVLTVNKTFENADDLINQFF